MQFKSMLKNSKPLPPTITNYQIMQSMRSTMLHIQCLIHFIDESIDAQDKNMDRQLKDRLMQLLEVYERHTQLEMSNSTKYLILQLQQILELQKPIIDDMWEVLDVFVKYLKGMKNMVRNFTRKIHVGRNIGVDIEKLNGLIRKTKVFLLQLMQEYKQPMSVYENQRQIANQIFSTMEQYCRQIKEILVFVSQKYGAYIQKKLRAQQQVTSAQIQEFTQNLLY